MKVSLRAMEPEDLELLYRIENDRELWNVGTTNVPYSRYSLHQYIANATGDIYADRQVRLIVEETKDEALETGGGETVGLLDIFNFDPRHQRAEIGIVVQQAHRRCGYATQALLQAAGYARDVLRLHQLYAYIDASNEASRRVFLKAGFVPSNTLHDWLSDEDGFHDALLMQYFF